MAQQQQVPRDLAARIAEIDNAVERVRKTIAESNEALEPHESRRIEAFCDASVAAIGSSVDELRDNLVACYSLSYRPTVNLDDASHSHLRIDAAVNNLRDAIVGTEQLAAQLGLRAAGREIATIRTETIETTTIAAELSDIKGYLTQIKSAIDGPKVQQISLVSLNIKSIKNQNTDCLADHGSKGR